MNLCRSAVVLATAAAFLAVGTWCSAQAAAAAPSRAPSAKSPLVRVNGPMGSSGGNGGGGAGVGIGVGIGAGVIGGLLGGGQPTYNSNLPYSGPPAPPSQYDPPIGSPERTSAFYDPSSGQYYPNSDTFVWAHLTGTEQPGQVFYGTDGNLYADGYNYRSYHPVGAVPGAPVAIAGTPGIDHGAYFWDPNKGNQQVRVVNVGGRLYAPGSLGADGKIEGGFYDPPTGTQVFPPLPPPPARISTPAGPAPGMSPAERAMYNRAR